MEYSTVRGMQDFLPERARKKKYIEMVCGKVFEKYGFLPLETPIVEELKLLTAKGSAGVEIEKEIYSFKDKSGRKLGLRFDLTVPLARVIVNNKQLRMPFKRYQIGRVFRYDRPSDKRWRSFTQADWDIIGVKSISAEFEIIAVAIDIMKRLGFKEREFKIKINSRTLLEEIALNSGVKKSQIVDCFRSIDKLEKIGRNGVKKELKAKGINTQILGQLGVKNLERLKPKNTPSLKELLRLMRLLKQNGLDKFIEIDLCLARGLEYYTGIVFEVAVKNSPSVGGGGRYDRLVEIYGGKPMPAVGCSFGIERLLANLEDRLELEPEAKLFVIPIGEKVFEESLKTCQKIRELGIGCEIDLLNRGIGKNIQYADKKGIPFVAIIGRNELKNKAITIKDLKTRKQKQIKLNNLTKLKSIIK